MRVVPLLQGLVPGILATAIAVAFATSCTSEPTASPDRPATRTIEAIADEYLAAYLERFPETATFYGIASAYDDELEDNSFEALAAWQKREDDWLAELESLPTEPEVGSRDWVTLGVLRESLQAARAARICRYELWPVSQQTGWQVALPELFDIQAVETAEQRGDLLARLQTLVPLIETEISNLLAGLEQGYSSPQHNVSLVAGEARGLLEEGSPLYSPLTRSDDETFRARYSEALQGPVRAAIERYARFLESDYRPRARTEISVTNNPHGAQCYAAAVRAYSTIERSPDEIYQLGLEQVAAIRSDMQSISEQHFGMDLADLIPELTRNPQFTFSSRQAVIEYHERKLDALLAALPQWFGLLPEAEVVIKPYPAYRDASGTGEYMSSSEDGTRPGIFYIPTRNPQQRSIAGQESLLFHEAYPGHHLQGAIALELGDAVHPLARYLYNSGYSEGWGLYSERLGDEMGLYSGPIDRLGMLSDQAARAARLVVDTGLHGKGWSRQQAIDYMLANTAWPPGDIESEIDRYIIMPGQATSYMLGMMEILAARQEAKAALGDRFDIREFHDRVLENGSVTLPMLRNKIRWWISQPS